MLLQNSETTYVGLSSYLSCHFKWSVFLVLE